MRYLSAVAPLVAVASARNWIGVDVDWALYPDTPAAWYESQGEQLPKLADAVTTVEANRSYVVKLDCIGCPFRIRKPLDESWQDPPRDNSLLFNITATHGALLLNGKSIAPLAPVPLDIRAYQIHANFSHETMDQVVEMRMLDSSWNLGTKFAQFDLQYEHSIVGTADVGKIWYQFDVLGAHFTGVNQPRSHMLTDEAQKLVQMLVNQRVDGEQQLSISIEDVQVVERKDRVQPFRMKCGALAIQQTQFNPLEWDYYGQFGTLTRSWHLLLWKTGKFFDRNGLVLIVLAVVFGAVTLVRRRVARLQQRRVADDAETALLVQEDEEAPPLYDDVAEVEEKEVNS